MFDLGGGEHGMTRRLILFFMLSIFYAVVSFAGETHKASGVVKELKANKVAISHGPISTMNMGAMTMLFDVADPEMLKDLKPGTKLDFSFDNSKDAMTITDFELK